jgi:hypothetical protein
VGKKTGRKKVVNNSLEPSSKRMRLDNTAEQKNDGPDTEELKKQ